MKKALILAYDFPPYSSIGAQRPYSWFKYFNKFGVYPIVVTRHWEGIKYNQIDSLIKKTEKKTIIEVSNNGTIIKVPYKRNLRDLFISTSLGKINVLRKFLSLFYQIFEFTSLLFDSKRKLYKEADKWLMKNNVDYIIATGEPFILFKYAHLLSKKHDVPWFADYRDDWISNHSKIEDKSLYYRFYNKLSYKRESKYLSNCAGVISVNDYLTQKIANRNNIVNYVTIENGVDLNAIGKLEENRIHKNFEILYSGIMYNFNYLEVFNEGVKKFMSKHNCPSNFKIRFIGITNYPNKAVEDAYSLQKEFPSNVEILPNIPFESLVPYLSRASLFLNLIAGDPSLGFLGAKCYMYASFKKPIISIPLIKIDKTNFFPSRDIHQLALDKDKVYEIIDKYYNLFEKKEIIKTTISDQEIYSLSRECKANQYISFLKK
jgi:hypothetical protein